ncbi:glycosyltransferase family 39 protein [Herbiconiux sp. CPCC 205763]|uniref:Glycosyltransferase family 39 protein n=1 Tax=Herbiconiux aconitum TaxID=2970913 RepID=A0ABT2GK53_9MICO|nr:glycosyltransferase family 39 protein [Herbiconiux aconitum]MCS5716602.1 glycosyltransferase family 39 protein [Herbiconiux aconitum]
MTSEIAAARMRLPRRSAIVQWVSFGVVFLWGLYLTFWNLGAANFNADEPIYLDAGWAYVHGDVSLNREHPPTAKYLIGFAQLLFGQGALSGRIAIGLCVVAGALILYFWMRREIGWVGALTVSGLWLVLPRGVVSGVRIDRFALLEPVMVFFAIAAFAAAWLWFRKRSWVWLIVSAALMALSVTSKISSIVLVPAILLLPLLDRGVAMRRRIRNTVLGGVLFGAVFAVVFVLLYLPMGIRSALTYMAEFQATHDAQGHLVLVAGVPELFPPWWANLLFTVDGMGVAAVIVLAAGALASLWARRVELVVYLGVGVLLLWIFYLVVSKVALPHYYYSWVWLFCALAGIGIAGLLSPKRRAGATIATRVLAVALLLLAVVSGAYSSVMIWNERAAGLALVEPALEELGLDDGDILVSGMADWEYLPYLDDRQTTDAADPDVVAVVTKDSVRFPPDPTVTAFLDEHAGDVTVETLDDVTLYVLD